MIVKAVEIRGNKVTFESVSGERIDEITIPKCGMSTGFFHYDVHKYTDEEAFNTLKQTMLEANTQAITNLQLANEDLSKVMYEIK